MKLQVIALWAVFTMLSLPAPAQTGAESEPEAHQLIMPVLAKGKIGPSLLYQSNLTFLNLAPSTLEATLEVFDSQGEPAEVICRQDGTSVAPPGDQLIVPGLGFGRISTAGGEFFRGWARLTWPLDGPEAVQWVNEIALLRDDGSSLCPGPICRRPSDAILTNAVVQATLPGKLFRAVGRATGSRHSAFSVVNVVGEATIQVRITFRDSLGQALTRNEVKVPPMGRITFFLLEQFFEAGVLVPNIPEKMVLEFESESLIAVGGLDVLFPDGELLSLPVDRLR